MFSKSTWLHLRIPFSYFLMPVFFFALAISPNLHGSRLLWVLFIIHFLLYPASNGYNSYFDKDEQSIGGLKNPPPVQSGLYYMALLFDLLAVVLGWWMVSPFFGVLLLGYGLASKAYSHPVVRLKRLPFAGWFTVVFFQGCYAFLMCYAGINDFEVGNLFNEKVLWAAGLTSVMLFATYPMTQIYQHEEDSKRGDKTISLLLGVRGTFYFAMIFFVVATAGFISFFYVHYTLQMAYAFLAFLAPVVIFFLTGFARSYHHPQRANYAFVMWLNAISATCLNGFFIWFFLETSHILQL
ncbi:MAG: UbiA family prenyltransferase [Bacteroidota bacterium]